MARTKKAEKATEVKETAAEVKTEKTETKPAKTAKAETKTETKPAAKTTKAAKETIKYTIEFGGKNVTAESIVDYIKEAYKAEGNTAAIKTLEVYIQPENGVAYYVINGVGEGKSVNF